MSDANASPPKDEFAKSSRLWLVWAAIFGGIMLLMVFRGLLESKPTVIAYCAQDQVYAEPIFGEFQKETGIKVRAVYDSEAVKTVGLANRLLAERSHPQCDVFWGNEEMRMRQLAAQNVFRKTNGWAAFGYRSRRMVINTNFVRLSGPTPGPSEEGSNDSSPPGRGRGWVAPRSLVELTNEAWRGKVALAYPQFGTTATHFHALRQYWGDAAWQAWCRALAANKPLLVDGNSVVVKMVGSGEAWIGLTDSDDIAAGQEEGLPIAALPINEETLLIPNTVAVVRGAPHLQAAQLLFDYLQRREVVRQLVAAKALEGVFDSDASIPRLNVNWDALLSDLESTTSKLSEAFLR